MQFPAATLQPAAHGIGGEARRRIEGARPPSVSDRLGAGAAQAAAAGSRSPDLQTTISVQNWANHLGPPPAFCTVLATWVKFPHYPKKTHQANSNQYIQEE